MSSRTIVISLLAALAALVAAPAAFADGPAWSVATTHTPSTFTEGQTGNTQTVTVTDSGTADSSGTVTLTARLGKGITLTTPAAHGTGWTCTTAGAVVTCTRADALVAGDSYPAVTITSNTAATAGVGQDMKVTSSFVVNGGGAAATGAGTDTIPVIGVPNYVTKSFIPTTWRQGDTGDSFSMYVQNQGGAPTSADANDPIIAAITPVAGLTITALSGGGWTCTLAGTTFNGVTIPADSCYRTSAVQSGEELPGLTVTVDLAANAVATIKPIVKVYGGGAQTVTSPSSTTLSLAVAQSADLHVTSTHAGTWTQGDQSDAYTLTVNNVIGANSVAGGPSVGTVQVTDVLPAGYIATDMSGAGWTCTLVAGTVDATSTYLPATSCVTNAAVTAAHALPPITVTVAVLPTAAGSLINRATVSGGGMSAASTVDGLQTTTDATTIAGAPDLITAVTHGGPFLQGDDLADADTVTVTPKNAGGADSAGGVTVSDTLPDGVTPLSATGSGWACTVNGQDVSCVSGVTVAAGTSAEPVTVQVGVTPGAPGSVDNLAQITGGGQAYTADDANLDQIDIQQMPDLIASISSPSTFRQADAADDYDVVVSDRTLQQTSGDLSVVVTLPAGITATSVAGSGWTCDVPSLTCTRSDALITFTPPIHVHVAVARDAAPSLTASATVSGGGELVAANDTDRITHAVSGVDATRCGTAPTLSLAYGTSGSVNVSCTGTGVTYAVTGAPAHGTLGAVGADGGVTYTPAAGFSGSDAFTVTATNALGETASQVVAVSVAAPPPPSADKPAPPALAPPATPAKPTPVHHRAKPRSVSLKLTAKKSKSSLSIALSGTVARPASVSKAAACHGGSVTITIKRGAKVLGTKRVKLSSSCTYRLNQTFSAKALGGKSGTLTVSARFGGNDALVARSAATHHLRFG